MTSPKITILLPDALHINTRNFPSFHQFVEAHKIKLHVNEERSDWIALYGEYEPKMEVLRTKVELLTMVPAQALFSYRFHGVNLFQVSRAETLARVSVRKTWHAGPFPDSAYGVFERLYNEHRPVLLQCMAAAMDWIEFWRAKLPTLKPMPTHCAVFSGSLIYARTLMELLRTSSTRVMVMESFFTGNDYYCEEKYEPIANNSDLRFQTVFDSLELPDSPVEYDRERVKAINKVLAMKNKNVQQPQVSCALPFDGSRPMALVLGQVANDFSVLEYKSVGLSTVAFYRELISTLLAVGYDVVFKDHPWELKKVHVRRPFTRELLNDWKQSLPKELQARVLIDSEINIREMFAQCSLALGLNSQSLIEAAFEGLKPVQFGNAFYGRKGFTHDYDLTDLAEFARDLAQGQVHGTLTLEEFDAFERFLTRALQVQLVSVNPSGVATLLKRFMPAATIRLGAPAETQPAAPAKPAPAPAPVKVAESVANAKPAAPLPKPSPAPVPAEPQTAVVIMEPAAPVRPEPAKETPEIRAALADPAPHSTLRKKFRKLLRSPKAFFLDARLKRMG